jgi:hypothetical protein
MGYGAAEFRITTNGKGKAMKQGQVITITIQTDNAAFEDDPGREVARILRSVAGKFSNGLDYNGKKLLDENGNKVGRLEIMDGKPF